MSWKGESPPGSFVFSGSWTPEGTVVSSGLHVGSGSAVLSGSSVTAGLLVFTGKLVVTGGCVGCGSELEAGFCGSGLTGEILSPNNALLYFNQYASCHPLLSFS